MARIRYSAKSDAKAGRVRQYLGVEARVLGVEDVKKRALSNLELLAIRTHQSIVRRSLGLQDLCQFGPPELPIPGGPHDFLYLAVHLMQDQPLLALPANLLLLVGLVDSTAIEIPFQHQPCLQIIGLPSSPSTSHPERARPSTNSSGP